MDNPPESINNAPEQTQSVGTALESWFAEHETRKRKSAFARNWAKFGGGLLTLLAIGGLWFGPYIENYCQMQWNMLVWELSETSVYRGDVRVVETSKGHFRKVSSLIGPYDTEFIWEEGKLPSPIDTASGRGALVLAVSLAGLLVYRSVSKKRYLRVDQTGLLISESLNAGRGDAEFVNWNKISRIEMPGQAIAFHLSNGRTVSVPWAQAVATCNPGALASALKTYAPEAAAECKKLHSFY